MDTNAAANTTTKPGVLAVMESAIARAGGSSHTHLKEASATVVRMAAALKAVSMLRQLGGIMPASREVVLVMCDEADAALADFRGEA